MHFAKYLLGRGAYLASGLGLAAMLAGCAEMERQSNSFSRRFNHAFGFEDPEQQQVYQGGDRRIIGSSDTFPRRIIPVGRSQSKNSSIPTERAHTDQGLYQLFNAGGTLIVTLGTHVPYPDANGNFHTKDVFAPTEPIGFLYESVFSPMDAPDEVKVISGDGQVKYHGNAEPVSENTRRVSRTFNQGLPSGNYTLQALRRGTQKFELPFKVQE